MRRLRFLVAGGRVGATCLLLTAGQPQPAAKKAPPKLEPVAETKVIMVGLAEPNLRGLGQLLNARPKDADAWVFARGQALLVAETGNLLMLRPPNGRDAQDKWMALAGELRGNAAVLAKATAEQDYVQARASLAATANVCNRCHQTFRVKNRVNPFPDERPRITRLHCTPSTASAPTHRPAAKAALS
ncbi:MAG: cytochrome c [Gemmataceae bacterium]|nr:cytochrome c [Gemmataceae bacterium]